MKVVREAEIEVIDIKDLEVNDEILWSNLRCRVQKIDWIEREVYFNPISQGEEPLRFRFYRSYYKLKKFKEVDICIQCSKEIESGDVCNDCKKAGIEYSKYLDEEYGVAF